MAVYTAGTTKHGSVAPLHVQLGVQVILLQRVPRHVQHSQSLQACLLPRLACTQTASLLLTISHMPYSAYSQEEVDKQDCVISATGVLQADAALLRSSSMASFVSCLHVSHLSVGEQKH